MGKKTTIALPTNKSTWEELYDEWYGIVDGVISE